MCQALICHSDKGVKQNLRGKEKISKSLKNSREFNQHYINTEKISLHKKQKDVAQYRHLNIVNDKAKSQNLPV